MKTSFKVKWLFIGSLSLVIGTAVLAAGARQSLSRTSATGDSSRALISNDRASHISPKVATPAGARQQPSIPTHIVYGIYFREIRELNKQADKLDNRGTKMDALREHHKKKGNLDDRQSLILTRIALATDWEVAKLDEQARTIIKAIRDRNDNGELKPGEPLPEVPEELKALQRQRDNLILSGREKLRQSLGASEFDRLDKFIHKDITDKAKPIQIKPHNKKQS